MQQWQMKLGFSSAILFVFLATNNMFTCQTATQNCTAWALRFANSFNELQRYGQRTAPLCFSTY